MRVEIEKEKAKNSQLEIVTSERVEMSREMLELKKQVGHYESLIETRTGEKNRLIQKVTQTKQRIDALELSKRELENEINQQIKENQMLQVRLKTNGDAQKRYEEVAALREQLSRKYNDLNEKQIKAFANLEKERDRCQLLEAQNKGSNEMIINLKEDKQILQIEKERLIGKYEDDLTGKKNEVERLTESLSQFKDARLNEVNQKEVRESRQEISTLRILNEQHQKEVTRFQDELATLEELKDTNRDLRLKLQRMEGELDTLRANTTREQEHMKSLQEQLSQGLIKIGSLEAQNDDLRKQARSTKSDLSSSLEEFKILSEKYYQLEGQSRELLTRQNDHANLKEEFSRQTEQMDTLKKENATKQEKLENSRNDVTSKTIEYEDRIKQLSAENKNNSDRVVKLSASSSRSEKESESLKSKVEDLQFDLTSAKAEAKQLQSLVEKQYNDVLQEKEKQLKNELLIARLEVEKSNLQRQTEAHKEQEKEKKELERKIQLNEIEFTKRDAEIRDRDKEILHLQVNVKAFDALKEAFTKLEIDKSVLLSKTEALITQKKQAIESKNDEIEELKLRLQGVQEEKGEVRKQMSAIKEKLQQKTLDNQVTTSKLEMLIKEKEEFGKVIEEKVSSFTERIQDYKEQVVKAENAQNVLGKDKKEITTQLWNAKDNLSKMDNRIKNLNDKLSDNKTELLETKQSYAQLNDLYNSVSNARQIMELEMNNTSVKAEQEVESLQEQIRVLEDTVSAQKEGRSRRDDEIQQVKTQLIKTQERMNMLQEENENLEERNEQVTDLKQSAATFQMEKESLQQRNKDLEEKLEEAREEKTEIHRKVEKLDDQIDQLRKQKDDQEHKAFGLSNEVEILKVQMSHLEKQRREQEKMETEYVEKTKEVVTLKAHLENSKTQLEQNEQKLQAKLGQLERTKVNLQYSTMSVETLESDHSDLKAKFDQMERMNQKNILEVEKLRGDKNRLEKEATKNKEVRAKLAVADEKRKTLELRVEDLQEQIEEQTHHLLGSPSLSLAGANHSPHTSLGEPGGLPIAHSPRTSNQESQLKDLMSKISARSEILLTQEDEYESLRPNVTEGNSFE